MLLAEIASEVTYAQLMKEFSSSSVHWSSL